MCHFKGNRTSAENEEGLGWGGVVQYLVAGEGVRLGESRDVGAPDGRSGGNEQGLGSDVLLCSIEQDDRKGMGAGEAGMAADKLEGALLKLVCPVAGKLIDEAFFAFDNFCPIKPRVGHGESEFVRLMDFLQAVG